LIELSPLLVDGVLAVEVESGAGRRYLDMKSSISEMGAGAGAAAAVVVVAGAEVEEVLVLLLLLVVVVV
jgi:hypothetical protein